MRERFKGADFGQGGNRVKGMLNIIAGGILFLSSAYIGLQIKRHYRRRRDFFADAVEFIDTLSDEIAFLKTPLPRIIARFCDTKKSDFTYALTAYASLINEGKATEIQSLAAALNLNKLSNPEKDIVLGLLSGLGKTDADTPLVTLKNYRAKLEAALKVCENQYKTTGMLSYKLGVLIGIGIMIFVA